MSLRRSLAAVVYQAQRLSLAGQFQHLRCITSVGDCEALAACARACHLLAGTWHGAELWVQADISLPLDACRLSDQNGRHYLSNACISRPHRGSSRACSCGRAWQRGKHGHMVSQPCCSCHAQQMSQHIKFCLSDENGVLSSYSC